MTFSPTTLSLTMYSYHSLAARSSKSLILILILIQDSIDLDRKNIPSQYLASIDVFIVTTLIFVCLNGCSRV